jgi:hypothetical protein
MQSFIRFLHVQSKKINQKWELGAFDHCAVVPIPDNFSWLFINHLNQTNQLDSFGRTGEIIKKAINSKLVTNSKQWIDFVYLYPNIAEITKIYSTITPPACISPEKHLYNASNSVFIPLDIRDWIYCNCVNKYTIQLSVNSYNVVLYIYSNQFVDQHQLMKTLRETTLAINVVTSLYKTRLSRQNIHDIEINFMLTPFDKILIEYPTRKYSSLVDELAAKYEHKQLYNAELSHKTITPRNVNSAMCSKSRQHSFISIWRTEEYPKVLIHELIHFFELEKVIPSISVTKILGLPVSDTFSDQGLELATECQTWMLHIAFMMLYKDPMDLRGYVQMVETEQKFAIYQAAKILNYFGVGSVSEWKKTVLNINSSAVYYYILKAAVVNNLSDKLAIMLMNPKYVFGGSNNLVRLARNSFNKMSNKLNDGLKDIDGQDKSLKLTWYG